MKKILLIIAAVIGMATAANAQSVFKKADGMVNLGIGLNAIGGYNMVVPPLSASYEYGILDNVFSNGNGSIGIGAYIGYASYKNKAYDLSSNHFVVGPRVALHYGFMNKLDTYIGLMLGYRSVSYGDSFKNEYKLESSGFAINANVGARYFFTPSIGGFLEVGYGVSNINLGVTFRM